jgi:hypothetical protein
MSDEKGQISIEFILIVGAVLTMVIVGIPMILKNAEMNRGLTAARDGATKGAAMRGLGFSSTGGNVAGVVKIINMTPIYKGNTSTGLDKYQLKFYLSVPSDMIDNPTCVQSSIGGTIRVQATSFMNYAFAGEYSTGFAAVNGSYYSFTTSCEFV